MQANDTSDTHKSSVQVHKDVPSEDARHPVWRGGRRSKYKDTYQNTTHTSYPNVQPPVHDGHSKGERNGWRSKSPGPDYLRSQTDFLSQGMN